MRPGRDRRLRCLHQRGTVIEAMLFAFELLELDGVDYRPLPSARAQGTARARDRSPRDVSDMRSSALSEIKLTVLCIRANSEPLIFNKGCAANRWRGSP